MHWQAQHSNEVELKASLNSRSLLHITDAKLIIHVRITAYEKEIQTQTSELQSLRVLKTE